MFGKQNTGITQNDDKIWLISFMKYNIEYFDETSILLEPIDNPFRINVHLSLRYILLKNGAPERV